MGTTVCDRGGETATRPSPPAGRPTHATTASREDGGRASQEERSRPVIAILAGQSSWKVAGTLRVPSAGGYFSVVVVRVPLVEGGADAPLRRPDEVHQLPDRRQG